MTIRILLAEDHVVVRESLRGTLEKQEDFEVVGEAGDGREVVSLARTQRPDVVVMDLSMPELNGIDATRQIVDENPRIRVLALSMHSTKAFVAEVLRSGGSGFLVKRCTSTEMFTAIRAVAQGKTYISPSVASMVVEGFLGRSAGRESVAFSVLSPREREVLQLLAEGNSTREIANDLNVSVSTVETHRRQIKTKLGIENLADLIKFAIREGLTTLNP